MDMENSKEAVSALQAQNIRKYDDVIGNMKFINGDCVEYMRSLPDKAFDLAVVDPPYGLVDIGCTMRGGGWHAKHGNEMYEWDTKPTDEYFNELFRVSKEQIVWGGNYFSLPPTRCFLVWYKKFISDTFTMAQCEYAWTSFNKNAKVFELTKSKYNFTEKIHPCEKPADLYKWIFVNYAEKGAKVIDTHMGSGSIALAAYDLDVDLTCVELSKEYYDSALKRIRTYTSNLKLF